MNRYVPKTRLDLGIPKEGTGSIDYAEYFEDTPIYNLAMQGDEPSRRIFHTFGRYLGMMLAGAVNVLNLDMYVLGGGVSAAWDAFAPTMFEELRSRSIVYAATAPANPMMTTTTPK